MSAVGIQPGSSVILKDSTVTKTRETGKETSAEVKDTSLQAGEVFTTNKSTGKVNSVPKENVLKYEESNSSGDAAGAVIGGVVGGVVGVGLGYTLVVIVGIATYSAPKLLLPGTVAVCAGIGALSGYFSK